MGILFGKKKKKPGLLDILGAAAMGSAVANTSKAAKNYNKDRKYPNNLGGGSNGSYGGGGHAPFSGFYDDWV